MKIQKKRNSKEKSKLHPRNKHQGRYDLQELCNTCPDLEPFLISLDHDNETIDFADPDAVRMLNKALLEHYYGVKNWSIPENYLCPPIPGRADYLHHIADLLASSNQGIIPKGKHIKVLDIGVGANCVYPLIGNHEYEWLFTGVDVDAVAIQNAEQIIEANPLLKSKIKFRLQSNVKDIFKGAMEKTERFDLTICNPPFYASIHEAQNATLKKLNNLNNEKVTQVKQNFGGQNRELWCHGGESKFIYDMINQSKEFETSCLWFSTLISNKAHLKNAYAQLEKMEAIAVKTLPMGQGNKISRVLAWTFLTSEQHQKWMSKEAATSK